MRNYKDCLEWWNSKDGIESDWNRDKYRLCQVAWDASAARFEGVVKALEYFATIPFLLGMQDDDSVRTGIYVGEIRKARTALKDLKCPVTANGIMDK